MESNKSELVTLIRNLCILVHTESNYTQEAKKDDKKLTEIIGLNSSEALDYISNAIDLALNDKKIAKERSYYEDFMTNETYQKEMQRLENEIRNHIKIEQQMKLYADALEEKNEKLEKHQKDLKKYSNQRLEEKKQENTKIKNTIASMKKNLESLKKTNDSGKFRSLKVNAKETEKYQGINKKINKAEKEYLNVSKAIAEFDEEYAQQKKDNEELKKILKEYVASGSEKTKEEELMYKNKYEQKCIEIELIKKKMRLMESSLAKKNSRSLTPNITKKHVQSGKIMKTASSIEKMKTVSSIDKMKTQRIVHHEQKVENMTEKKRLPLNFTARR